MRFLKIFILLCLISLFTAKAVSAYYTPPEEQIPNFENSVYGLKSQYNLPSSVKATLDNLIISLNQSILGPMTEAGQQAVGPKSGALYALSGLIAEMYKNPPASSAEYFADLGQNLGIAKPVHAQGVGFTGLRNLLPLWKASRNLAYIFFVVVFLYMGLAIMFRVKLDPKTVITIQNSIPKLVVALILVTFSYAIVGLMIDLIYLLIYLGILALQGPIETAGSTLALQQSKYINLSFVDALILILRGGISTITKFPAIVVGAELIPLIAGLLVLGATPWVLAGLALPILILAVIALFLVIKLFFSLIGAYIGIIISVITAPIQIMLGALPGSQGGFSSWFRNLTANILVFPAVALFLLLGWLLTTSVGVGPTWTPPVISAPSQTLPAILGLGMLLLVNKIPEMIKTAFKMKPVDYGRALGEVLGPAQMAYKAGASFGITRLESREHAGLAGIVSTITGVRGGGGRSMPQTGKVPQTGQPAT